ncbi:conjugal transfer protein MobA [Bacteroides rodentium]|uniref:conjugal transfer protein MobA n=1 Tax=Bacteroides rodentium TaxID=691816 RepID=UPI0004717120|nr:conjugal transfer protein MobA [Bacteroides rodentium]
MKEKKKRKAGRNPKLDPAVYRYTVRFNEEEHNRFLAMFEKLGVYARSVFLKTHFFGQPFKALKVDKTLVDCYTKLSDFHAQFRAVGTNYNQVVKELRLHFSEKKAMALLYQLTQHTIELVKLSRQIVELSRAMEAKWQQLPQQYDSH